MGSLWLEPFIEVEKDSQRIGASFKDADISHCITIDDFMIEFENKSPFDIRDIEFIKEQKGLFFPDGLGDPLDLSLYQDNGGYHSLKNALSLDQQSIINKIKDLD